MAEMDSFLADLQNAVDLYNTNWVMPYGTAYARAHARFQQTLDDQKKYDEMKRDLFLTAATIGFGAGIGAAFGKTALKAVVADQALTFVCNRNMNRTFNLMANVSASVPGTFIVDKVWDQVETLVSAQVKTQVTGIFNAPAPSSGIKLPQEMQNDLARYVLNVKTAAHAVGAEIRDSAKINPQQKAAHAQAMRNSHFYAKRPTRDLIGDVQKAADTIELSFYMVMVMNSDYMVQSTSGTRGAHEYNQKTRLGPVTVPTTDKSYGAAPAAKFEYGLGYSRTTMTYVEYDDLGSKVLDRVNALYNAKYRADFIPNAWYQSGDTTKEAVAKAEKTLTAINAELVSNAPGT